MNTLKFVILELKLRYTKSVRVCEIGDVVSTNQFTALRVAIIVIFYTRKKIYNLKTRYWVILFVL